MNNPVSYQIETKSGVVFHPHTWHTPEMWRIAFVVRLTAPSTYNPTITAGVDGQHLAASFHYIGGALDWRIRDFPGVMDYSLTGVFSKNDIKFLRRWEGQIRAKLGSDFYVELELMKVHIHVHWKKMLGKR